MTDWTENNREKPGKIACHKMRCLERNVTFVLIEISNAIV